MNTIKFYRCDCGEDVYEDDVHVNSRGRSIIGAAIARRLESEWGLRRRDVGGAP